ncbi:MAG: T9SS C-terminal target domain-containing protein [Candidatus Symbiothrix sp.]|jgi:hypothetical protein|nr:T9SS C-terminal target domain-containing protein [Candidatus Symbiothrix sp.]
MKYHFLHIIVLLIFLTPTVSVAQTAKKEKTVVVEESPAPELSVSNNILTIKNARVGSKLQILTIVGNKIKEIEIDNTEERYELNLPKAIYIFKLDGVVRKFVIR